MKTDKPSIKEASREEHYLKLPQMVECLAIKNKIKLEIISRALLAAKIMVTIAIVDITEVRTYVTVGFSIIPLYSDILNDLNSHLTEPVVNKSLEMLHELHHREEPYLSNHTVYSTQHTLHIHH